MVRHLAITADCHAGPQPEVYRQYLDPAYRKEFDEYLAGLNALYHKDFEEMMGGELFHEEARQRFSAETHSEAGAYPGAWDPSRRLQDLEADGVVAEVIFPDPQNRNAPPFNAFAGPGVGKPELQAAGAKAYNRWLAECCSENPGRHAGVAILTLDDIEATVQEVRWASQAGLRGVMIPVGAGVNALPPYNDLYYEPLWAVCAELGMPVHTHAGAGTPIYGRRPGAEACYLTEVSWFAHRVLWFLIWGGVFERYPSLRYVATEQGTTWIPSTLAQLDGIYTGSMFPQFRKSLSLKPSEYWAKQGWVGASFMRRQDSEMRHAIGIDKMMWGSDYPHLEGTWPHTAEKLREAFGGVPHDEVAAMIGGNAAKVYGFDVQALRSVADRIGPELTTSTH